jgi:mRNA-degrading endonuclease RelE of RelBE toxin-antitoxin system
MTYTIDLAKEAEADLVALHKADRRIFNRVLSKIESLSEKPFEGKPLVGNHKGEYALRVGNYRISASFFCKPYRLHPDSKHRKQFISHSLVFSQPKTRHSKLLPLDYSQCRGLPTPYCQGLLFRF